MKTNLFFSGCFFLCVVVQIFAQDPYPDFPPANVTAEQDRNQMLWNDKKIPMPLTDKAYLDGDIGYRRHRGGHVASPNYPAFADFVNKYWNSNVEY